MFYQFRYKIILLVLIFLHCCIILCCQFQSNFSVDQFSNPFVNINKDKKLIIATTSGSDTVKIANYKFIPRRIKYPNRLIESYFIILDSFNNITDSLQFFGTQGVELIGSYLDDYGNYYFALTGPDTLYSNNNLLYLNPYKDAIFQVYIFRYNINSHKLILCKVIGNAENYASLYADEKSLFIGVKYTFEAMVDTFRFGSLLKGSIHEHDILLLRLSLQDFELEYGNGLLGYDENIPLQITADSDQNIYLAADVYSPFLVYNNDTITLDNSSIGNGLYMKFSRNGELDWYHITGSIFLKSIILENGSSYVLGNYINSLIIDSLNLSTSPSIEDGFIISFMPNGDYLDLITFNGQEDKKFNILKKGKNGDLILAGQFNKQIIESNPISVQSLGATDSYVYFMDLNGKVKTSFYFQGDSTEYIEDISLLENGNTLVLGHTFSDTVFCRKDTLIIGNHKKNYFIYEIPAPLLNYNYNKDLDYKMIHVYPIPFQDYFIIDCSQMEDYKPTSCVIYNQEGVKLNCINLNEAKTTINSKSLISGMYLLQIENNKGEIYIKKINKI